MFGYTNWTIISNPLYHPDATSGTYNIGANFFSTYDRALLLFQSDEPSDSLPYYYVGYLLLAANGTTGSWTSPFDDEDGCSYYRGHAYGCKNKVAYIKLLGHIKPPEGPPLSAVPLPAPIFLLALALGGMGFAGWYRRRTATPA